MVMNSNVKLIGDYLDKLFPNPKTELNFNCDYELLIAVIIPKITIVANNSIRVKPLSFISYLNSIL